MPRLVSAVQTWLRWSVPWWTTCARRMPVGAWKSQPSPCSTTSSSGSRPRASSSTQSAPLAVFAARSSATDTLPSSSTRTGESWKNERYQPSLEIRWPSVMMIGP